ncbi:hypothetical protein CHS0354_022836 [Potamilus streckersoni]|uniref:G-protein coupled receptors family 1 profile domain-containing protein n=1 Tax=Potamilus streckersoni TaxID=2493646 RepID=A0AAE0S2C6_9BIVA|nr:hypothetical protein CHS0354_022836 [Potamilus streckersoni]
MNLAKTNKIKIRKEKVSDTNQKPFTGTKDKEYQYWKSDNYSYIKSQPDYLFFILNGEPQEISKDILTMAIGFYGYIVLILTASIFNLCLLIAILANRKLRTMTNIIVASLAISDFFIGSVVCPSELIHYITNYRALTAKGCAVHQAVQIFIPLVSSFHLLAVAIERYVKIVEPLRYFEIATKSRLCVILLIIWIFPLLISVLPITGWNQIALFGNVTYTNVYLNMTGCDFLETLPCTYMGMILTIILSVYIVMFGLYVKVFFIALSQVRQIKALKIGGKSASAPLLRSELKVLIVLTVTIGFFFISWLPIGTVIAYDCVYEVFDDVAWGVSLYIAFVNASVNPLIYGIGNREIRKVILQNMQCPRKTNVVRPEWASMLHGGAPSSCPSALHASGICGTITQNGAVPTCDVDSLPVYFTIKEYDTMLGHI